MTPLDEKARDQIEDLRETRRRGIEEGVARKRGKRRGCGCGILIVIAILVAILTFFFQDTIRENAPEDLSADDLRQSFQGLLDKGRSAVSKSPDQLLDDLRKQALSIQGDWGRLIESGEAQRKLEALRADLQKRREAVGEVSDDLWRQTIQKTDAVLESLADKKTDAIRQLRELDKMLEEIQRRLPGFEATDTRRPQNDDQ